MAHFIFNFVTALFAVVFIYQLKDLVDFLSPYLLIKSGDNAMQLALFHTIFNVIGVLLVSPFIGRLVRFLETLFRVEEKGRGQPKYLTQEVVEIPSAGLEALRKEVIHLYDKSLEAIVHAMNLHRSDIFSDKDIDEIVERSRAPIRIDIDQVYHQDIKSLYGEIIRYASISQSYMDQQGNEKIYQLKRTARRIVEMVKDVRELQKNLNFYAKSNKTVIFEKYNRLRFQLISVLRMIQQIRDYEGDVEDVMTRIEVQRQTEKEHEISLNREVDALIRENKIDSASATSLINDIGFAHSIGKKLLNSAATLWVKDQDIIQLGDEYGHE